MNSKVAKSADDMKLFRVVETITDQKMLQKDLTKLSKWATRGQIEFNAG